MSEPIAAPIEAPQTARPRPGARQAWIERLARFAESGLRPAAFCAQEGVSLPSFYSWKRRLSAPACSPDAQPTPDTRPSPRLLPVRLPSANTVVELVLCGGTVLRVGPGCDLAFVRALIEALGDAPC